MTAMNAIAFYLLKSTAWLSGFFLVFFLFLRNERFFKLNRIFLMAGIVLSVLMPLFTIHYYIDVPQKETISAGLPQAVGVAGTGNGTHLPAGLIISILYMAGALSVIMLIFLKSRAVIKSIRKSDIESSENIKIIRTEEYPGSFSFFSYVFVNPSVSDVETREIVNHELGHIRQRHWVDLVLAELLCVIQWFNPLTWIYSRFIRQNHEYLADAEALQRSSDPALYRATLINQIVGTPVFILANSFNYSLNKKRFKMMKKIISSPYRKMRTLFILPVMALILFAFSKPEYKHPSGTYGTVVSVQGKEAHGKVQQQGGTALPGANVIIQGTTVGTITDQNGEFRLRDLSDNAVIVVSYIGYKTKVVKAAFNYDMVIEMVKDTLTRSGSLTTPPAPPDVPPPPPPPYKVKSDMSKVLLVIDGKESDLNFKTIDPETIASMNVLKDEEAIKKYGDKGRNGVIELTFKSINNPNDKREIYVAVEQLPVFPGGEKAMLEYINKNVKYPQEAAKKGIKGQVMVTFVVMANGKLSNIKVEKPVNPLLDAEAVRVVSTMPLWTPGKQSGKPVDVVFMLPVNFELK